MVNDYRPCPDEQVSAWSSLLRVMWLCSCCRLVRAQVHHGATDLATVFFCLDQGWGGEGSETISLHTQKKNPLYCFASRQNSLTVSPDTARELWSLWTSRGESHGSIRHTGGAMWIKLEEQEGAGAQGRAPALQRVKEKSLEHARTPRSLKILGVPGLTVCWVTPFPSTLWQLASVFHPRGSSQTF